MSEILLKSFYSKKNTVTLVDYEGLICIRKIFADATNCRAEEGELRALYGLCVPQIIKTDYNCIYMTYIEGELFLEKYFLATIKEMPRLALMLADFIKAYSNTRKGKCLADLNFRNFIISEEKLYGVDFENTMYGAEISAVASAIAFAILYDIEDMRKKAFVKALISQFDFDKNQLTNAVEAELNMLIKRRNIDSISSYALVNYLYNN